MHYGRLRVVVCILVCAFTSIVLVACSSNSLVSLYSTGAGTTLPISSVEASFVPVEGFASCPLNDYDFSLIRGVAQGTMIPDTLLSEEGKRRQLSIPQMNHWRSANITFSSESVPLVIGSSDVRPVFVAVFDGTWNDKDDPDAHMTVPGLLAKQIELSRTETSLFEVKYYNGVGTRVSMWRRLLEGTTGIGTKERAEKAFRDFMLYSHSTGTTPHAYVIGFSRGAASARHFLNLLDPVLQAAKPKDSYWRAHAFALLFDTVATGQYDILKLGIPPSTIFAIHLVADLERRLTFPVVKALPTAVNPYHTQRIIELHLPAVHSDLGGGYGNGLEKLMFAESKNLLARQGFDLTSVDIPEQHLLNMGRHNSDWPGTAIGQWFRRLCGYASRESLEPIQIVSSASPFDLDAYLEMFAREIESAKRELHSSPSKPVGPNRLSIQLQTQSNGIVLTTNCPEHVSFDLRTRWLFLSGQPYKQLTELMMRDVADQQGYILITNQLDAADYRPKTPQ